MRIFSNSTSIFWLKLLLKVKKLSLVSRLGLLTKFDARNIKFELNEGRKTFLGGI